MGQSVSGHVTKHSIFHASLTCLRMD